MSNHHLVSLAAVRGARMLWSYDRETRSVEIALLRIPSKYRGKGVGRALLTLGLINIVKYHPDVPIMLEPRPLDDDTDYDKLVDFYESFGFVMKADGKMYSAGIE